MDYMGSLSRPTVAEAEPDNRQTAGANSDSSIRLKNGVGPLLYTSAIPAARMQIITRPLAGIPSEASIHLNSNERIRLIVASAISLLFIALVSFMVVVAGNAPDIGISTQANAQGQQIITWVVPYGLAYDQGVRPGDIVVSEVRQGNSHTVAVASGTTTIEVATSSVTSLGVLQRWSFIFLSLIFIGVGGSVYVKARQRVSASAFYSFCLASAVCLVLAPNTYLGYGWLLASMFVSVMLWAGSFAFFFLKFPVRAGKTRRRHRLMVSAVTVGGVVGIAAYLWVFTFNPTFYWLAQLFAYLYLMGCVGLGLASLGRALFKERASEVRQQMSILLIGTALAVGPSLLLSILPSVLNLPNIRAEITALTLGIMPLAFAYAITQGQMLGVRNFIRRSVVYVLMGFSVLIAFSLAVGMLGAIVPKEWQQEEVGLISFSLFVFAIAISYGYIQRHVERLVDKYIYHDAYDYKEALLQFSAQLAAEQNLHMLADELVQSTCRMMNLTCGVLLLATPAGKSSEQKADRIFNKMDVSSENAEAIWGALNTSEPVGLNADIHSAISSSSYVTNTRNVNSVRNRGADYAAQPNQGGEGDPHDMDAPFGGKIPLRVVPYARYGDFADWLIDGLHYELSQLGIRLDEADTPMQLIYFNQPSTEHNFNNTSELRTSHLSETGTVIDPPLTVTGLLSHSALTRNTGSLNSNIVGRSNGSGKAVQSHARGPDADSIHSFLGVPLWTRSRFVGVLCLGGKKTGERFTKDDLSLLSTLGSQAALAIYNAQLYEAREQALLDTIGALAHAIEAKDGYTIQHCENMTGRALALAQAIGLPIKDVENIRMGAILHDIGKIGIPDAVLNKPGKLTSEEYELMKQHAAIGARIVQSVGALNGVVPIVRYHQERYDGSGYPEGLKGEAIPIGARIIGVVDTYGAMTEDRVYRATPGHHKALEELQRLAGKQFDPQVVEAFINLLEERPDLAELPAARVV
ncbi:MAG: HD domain-containing phosphohydrolase [Sphingomicrobium sp.]